MKFTNIPIDPPQSKWYKQFNIVRCKKCGTLAEQRGFVAPMKTNACECGKVFVDYDRIVGEYSEEIQGSELKDEYK